MATAPVSAGGELPVYAPPIGHVAHPADVSQETPFRTDWSRYHRAAHLIVARDLGLTTDAIELAPGLREMAVADYDTVLLSQRESGEPLTRVRMTAVPHEPGIVTLTVVYAPAAAQRSQSLPMLRGAVVHVDSAERRIDVKVASDTLASEIVPVGAKGSRPTPPHPATAAVPNASRAHVAAREITGGAVDLDGMQR